MSTNSDRIKVCSTDELPPGERKIITVGNRKVGVFNVDGEYRAILNTCPHQNGPLCEGNVLPKVSAKIPDTGKRPVQQFDDSTVVKCPWHGWEFDLESGELLDDERIRLPVFDVSIEDETVYLTI